MRDGADFSRWSSQLSLIYDTVPDEAPQGRFVIPIISPDHHQHDLELSGSCPSNKSEFLLNQYPQSAPFQLHSQVWNDDSHTVSSIAAQDPHWWTDFVNTEPFANEVHQTSQIMSGSVYEASHANEAPSRISAVFQTAFQPSGSGQQSVDFNVLANFPIDFDSQAFQAYSDSANSKSQNSIPLIQPNWNSTESSSTPEFDCDPNNMTSTVFSPLRNKTVYQESQENPKSQISVLRAFRCPQCVQLFSSERLGYVFRLLCPFLLAENYRHHIQKYHKHLQHPNICGGCRQRFSIPKDLKRHLETSTSCRKGSARPFACKCGSTFTRKDHFSRHIRNMARRSEDEKHLAV